MKLSRALLSLICVVVWMGVAFSQEQKANEVVEIDGEKFVLHKVKMGETIYSLCKLYKVENKDLLNHNPNLIGGLNVGSTIKIPFSGDEQLLSKQNSHPIEPSSFIQHTIQRKETPYFVAKKYGIQIEDIYKYNPQLTKFKRNKTIRIPQWDRSSDNKYLGEHNKLDAGEEQSVDDEMIFHRVKPGETAYSLSKLYGCSIAELYFYNPDARNMRIGMEIRIPKKAQEKEIEPELEAEGNYFIHMIASGETLYGLLRKYHVSREEMEELNPVLLDAFPAGVNLRIPVKYLPKKEVKPVNESAFIKHIVQKGETLYRLSVSYDLAISEIKKYNPALSDRDGLIWGETILIPKKPDEEIAEFIDLPKQDSFAFQKDFYQIEYIEELPESCKPTLHSDFFFKTYHVGLLLPLFLEANDTLNNKPVEIDSLQADLMELDTVLEDSIIEEKEELELVNQFYGNTENFLHFYEGVLLAIDSMKNLGMNVQLHVFDTKRDISIVDSIVNTREFRLLDLILGPIYPHVQSPVADFALRNRIPMVSPLSNSDRVVDRNAYYYQINPTYRQLLRSTANYISDDYFNSNFIVLKMNTDIDGIENDYVNLCHEKLFNSGYYNYTDDVSFRIYDFKKMGSFGLSRILSRTKENVFIIPSSSEGEISEGVSNINNYASDYRVTVVGTNKFEGYKSISQEAFHNVKLKFIDPYWIDFAKQSTVNFYGKFRDTYKCEPNQFSVQGYDATFYFLNALWNYGDNFQECLPYMDVDLIQGNYYFEKVSDMGGYMNTGASLISYELDYTVNRIRELGKVQFIVRK